MEPIRIPSEMFRFAAADHAGVYTAMLHAFAEANERLDTALGLDDVRNHLRSAGRLDALDDGDLTDTLDRMREWGLVEVVHNHSTSCYRTALEFERRNRQYSLTRQGAAAFAGIEHAETLLASTGSALQTAVLDAIADRLADLLEELATGTDRGIFGTLGELESRLESLRTDTTQFNAELQRLLRAENPDPQVFREVKVATVAYLQEFLAGIDGRRHTIAARIEAIEGHGVELMHRRALIGAELPRWNGADPQVAWLDRRRARWAGLRAWFLPEDDAVPRIEQLHQVGRRAIVTLLQVQDRITEARRGTGSTVADFRELARWFAILPEGDMHRLWSTAFGMSPARHAHLVHPDPELVGPSVPWPDAPPVPVSPLLRSAGRTERFSRTGKVRDVAGVRAQRAGRAALERAQLEAAWSMLDTGGIVRLSAFGRLEHGVFERLLDLLGRALGAGPNSDGVHRGTTGDGRFEILLRPPPDTAIAELRTPQGFFRGPDFLVEIAAATTHTTTAAERVHE